MNKKVLIPVLMLFIATISYFAYDAYAADVNLEGKAVDVSKIIMGSNAEITSAEATTLIGQAKPIAFQATDGKLYFIYSTSGASAVKKLAKYADKTIVIEGKSKVVGGINVITASSITGK